MISSSSTSYFFDLCIEGTTLIEGGKNSCQKCNNHGVCEGGYGKNYP